MNLLLDHMLQFNQQAIGQLTKATRIPVVHEEDTWYGWVSYHPETNTIAQILFHEQPETTFDPFGPFYIEKYGF
jgi:hypothetical protein